MQRKLLFAEDDKTFHEIVRKAFIGTGWEVSSVYDGEDALESIAGQLPDVILLDLNMPRLGGRELLASLRRNPRTAMVPVIIVSGDDSPREKAAEFGIGADDFVSKPFDTTELVARIDAAARRARRMLSANPLTMLPGGPAIEDEVRARISNGTPLAFFHIDIDNFKAYNDNYGYLKGDEAIRRVARLLTEVQGRFPRGDIFVGHVGGDDYVLMCRPEVADEVAALVAYGFDAAVPELYSAEDAGRGYISAMDRNGKARLFPLMGLTIAVATNEKRALCHYAKIVDIASEIKKYLKSRPGRTGSAWLKDRRED